MNKNKQSNKFLEIELMSNELSELTKVYDDITLNPYKTYIEQEKFIKVVKSKFNRVSDRLHTILSNFRSDLNSGLLLLKNLPFDKSLPPTPNDLIIENYNRDSFFSEMNLTLFGSYFGELFSFEQENNGDLYQNVVATNRGRLSLTSRSSTNPLPFHTEDSFHPFSPDYLSLVCLREDPKHEARTTFVHIDDIFQNLNHNYKKILFKKKFINQVAHSFKYGEDLIINKPTYICYGDLKNPFIKYNFLMKGLDQESDESLDILRSAFQNNSYQIELNKGELMIINNRKILHGRTKYTFIPESDRNRWLKRVFIIKDLSRALNDIDSYKNSRIIKTDRGKILKGSENGSLLENH